jgi:hypothetical protein
VLVGFDYLLKISSTRKHLDVTIVMLKEDRRKHMMATLRGTAVPFNQRFLLRTMLWFPLTAFMVFPRITWEAAKLAFKKKLRVFAKPNPRGFTITHLPPSGSELKYMKIASKIIEKSCHEKSVLVSVVLPGFENQEKLEFGPKGIQIALSSVNC